MITPAHSSRLLAKLFLSLLIACTSVLLISCSEDTPIKMGFVGGLTGKVSDLGGPARNGMLLAVEEANAEGGINGRNIITLIKDDKQNKELAVQSVNELIAEKVDVIIGPATSSMAVEVAPLATTAKTLMVGVTVTTNALSDMDDYFMRCLSATAVHAGEVADFLYSKRGIKSFSAAYDLKNAAYTESWVKDFSERFEQAGGQSRDVLSFTSGNQNELISLAEKLVAGDPEIVIFVTNAVDAALLAKLVRERNPEILLATSEWAGTERLIELGGKYVEGAYIPQYLDRESKDPEYVAFRNKFMARFNQEPGFPGLTAYNATNMVIDRLKHKPEEQGLKEAILEKGTFKAVQGVLKINQYGDAESKTYVTQVTNGRFVVQTK